MELNEPTLMCPVLGTDIYAAACIVYQDCVDGMIKAHNLPAAFRAVKNYRETCENCPNREPE